MKRAQLTITYPEHEAEKLYRTLLLLRDQRCLNRLSILRQAIDEKLKADRSEGGMNKTYRVVLSDDEQKMLAVVLKKERLRDLQDFLQRLLREWF